ncbi:MAG: YihY/virulence factor BrkB family protein [Acidimicrobiales bacterium]
MNPIEKRIRRLDAFQQRHLVPGFVFGIIKKYGDDNAGNLAGALAHSAFGSVFPLLLFLVTILGIILGSHSALRNDVVHSTLRQFPIVGSHLGSSISALHRNSVLGLGVGIGGTIWGSIGLAENGIFTMMQVWNLPGPQRPNYPKRMARAIGFLVLLGVGLLATTFLTGVVPRITSGVWLTVGSTVLSALLNSGEYLVGFRILTPGDVRVRQLLPGAVVAGCAWTVIEEFGGLIVGHYLMNDTAVYGLFAIVLGLFAWIYIGVQVTVYAAEINVVLARKLWPRAIVNPPMTRADRRSMAAQANQNRRRPEQRVRVTFTEGPLTEDEFFAAGGADDQPGGSADDHGQSATTGNGQPTGTERAPATD